MKRIIITVLVMASVVAGMLAMSGCSDDELIELGDDLYYAEDSKSGDAREFVGGVDGKSGDAKSGSVGESGSGKSGSSMTGSAGAEENSDTEAGNSVDSRPLVVCIYVCGEVKKPGVYEMSEGSRIIDAISEAGGYTEKACITYLNLADYVSDSQMIYVPSFEEIANSAEDGSSGSVGINAAATGNPAGGGVSGAAGGSSGGGGSSVGGGSSNGLVNINTASKAQLMELPGIGEAKAEKIIEYREANGPFASTEDIMQISGIKEGMYSKIKDRICVR